MAGARTVQCEDCDWTGSPIEFIKHWNRNRTHNPKEQ